MFLAGVPVNDKRVLAIAAGLRDAGLDDTAERLETAYDRETKMLALSIANATRSSRCSSTAPKGSESSGPCSSTSRNGEIAKGSAPSEPASRAVTARKSP